MSIMPQDPDSKTDIPPDDEVLISWRECSCEWSTKYCDDNHVRYAVVRRSILPAAHGDAR